MNARILIAGLAGAVAMFAWSALAHMLLPLGTIGVNAAPDDRVAAAMQQSFGGKAGFYIYPHFEMQAADHAKAMADYSARTKVLPQGVIVYTPAGAPDEQAKMFVGELGLELVESLLAAWLLSMTALSGLAGRVAFVGGLGLIAAITTNGSYWNWYRFPLDYSLSYGFTQFMGFVAAGVAIALVLGRKPAS